MGLLDDAIREHLDLKRRRGADPAEIELAEREALGPIRREPLASEAVEPEPLELADDTPDQSPLNEPHPGMGEMEPLELGSELHDQADEGTPAGRHGSGARSLFGRLRRGGEPNGSEDESEPLGHEDLPPPHSAAHADERWDDEYGFEQADDLPDSEPLHDGPGTVAFHPPSEWENEEPPAPAGDLGSTHPEAPAPSVPPPHRADPPASTGQPDLDETAEYEVDPELSEEPERRRPPAEPPDHAAQDEDVLEETPEFLHDTPDHDRLWFEQRPPRDFDFDG